MVHVNFSGTFLEPAPPLALSTFVPDLYFVISTASTFILRLRPGPVALVLWASVDMGNSWV